MSGFFTFKKIIPLIRELEVIHTLCKALDVSMGRYYEVALLLEGGKYKLALRISRILDPA